VGEREMTARHPNSPSCHFILENDPRFGSHFRYIDLWQKEVGTDKKYYPVYAIFSRESIDFYYHSAQSPKTVSENQTQPTNPLTQTNHSAHSPKTVSDNPLPHVHQRVLHMPLSENLTVKDNLTSIIKDCSNGEWHLSDKSLPAVERQRQCGYAELTCWPFKSSVQLEHRINNGLTISLSRILLDFLFDLEHEKVFRHSPLFEKVETLLLQTPLVNSIHDKAEYYWCRHRFLEADENCRPNNAKADAKKAKISEDKAKAADNGDSGGLLCISAQQLAEAEMEWLRVVTTDVGSEVLQSGGDWFIGEEDEVRSVMFIDGRQPGTEKEHRKLDWISICRINVLRNRVADPNTSRDWSRKARLVSSWFLRRYDLDAAALCVLSGAVIKIMDVLDWNKNGDKNRNRQSPFRSKTLETVLKTACLLPVFTYLTTFIFLYWSSDAKIFSLIAHPAFWGEHFFTILTAVLIILHIILIAIYFVKALRILRKKKSTRSNKKTVPLPFLPVQHVVWATLLLIVELYLMADIGGLDGARTESLIPAFRWGVLVIVPSIVFLLALLGLILQGMKSFQQISNWILLLFRMTLPRIIFAVCASWIILAVTEEIAMFSLLTGWTEIVIFGLPLIGVTVFFGLMEIHKQTNDPGRALLRSSTLIAITLFVSLMVGFLATNFFTRSVLVNSQFLTSEEFYDKVTKMTKSTSALPPFEDFCLTKFEIRGFLPMFFGIDCTKYMPPSDEENLPFQYNGLFVLNTDKKSKMPTLVRQILIENPAQIHWSASQIRFAQLEVLSWGVHGVPLSQNIEENGIPVMYVTKKKFLRRHWIVFPGMLLLLSCVSVFAALFLQLLFEDKPITEPL